MSLLFLWPELELRTGEEQVSSVCDVGTEGTGVI